MAVVGSAEVVVRAITTRVKEDIRKAFRDARPIIEAEGKSAGEAYAKSFGSSINDSLTAETRTAIQNTTRSIREDLGNALPDSVRPGAAQAGDTIRDELTQGGDDGGRGAGNAFTRSFASAFGGIGPVMSRTLADVGLRVASVSNAFDLIAPAIANVVGMVSSLASGLFAVVSAAGQAAGALAVLPGLLGVLAQVGGVIKLGSGGISEALKAGTAVTSASTAAATANAAATKSAAAGMTALQQATEKASKAQNNLTNAEARYEDTQKKLAHSRDVANEGIKSQIAAEYFLNDAKNRFAAGDTGSASVNSAKKAADGVAKARISALDRVKKAEDRNDKARQALSKAQRAKAAADAAVDKARKAGSAASTTVSPEQRAVNAYEAALAKLTPQAQAFVKQLLKTKAAFKGVGNAISAQMFPPLTEALEILGDSSLLDVLKDELGVTGGLIGNIGKSIVEAFTTSSNMSLFESFLHRNNGTLAVFNKTTEDGTTPIQSLVNVFLKLAVAIQPVTRRFAEWVATLLTGFDASHSVDELRGYFIRAGNVAAILGETLGNIFSVIGQLGGVAAKPGKSMLISFRDATEELDKFVKKAREDGSLRKFFLGVKDNFMNISRLLKQIGREFLELGDNEGIGKLAEKLTEAAEKAGEIADKLTSGEVGEALGDLVLQLTELADTFTQSSQITLFIDTLSAITGVVDSLVSALLKIPGAGAVLAGLAVFRAVGVAAGVIGLTKQFAALRGSIAKLIAMPFKALGTKIKGVFGRGDAAPDADPTPTPGGPEDETQARTAGERIGEALSEGIAAGITINSALIDAALEETLLKLYTTFQDDLKLTGNAMGEDIATGLAAGIRSHLSIVAAAGDDLGDAVVAALKLTLGIASPSTVMAKQGEDTGEGFVLGVRAQIAEAAAAGRSLGTAAATGAASGAAAGRAAGATAPLTTTTTTAASRAGRVPVIPPSTAANTGKAGAQAAKAAKGFKGLAAAGSAASLALVGVSLPVLAVIAGIALFVVGLIALYKNSKEFRKFVDGIVGKLKELGKWFVNILKKYVLPVLDDFFGWVNDNLPKLGKIIGQVFSDIAGFFTTVLIPAFKSALDFIMPVLEQLRGGFEIAFKAILFYIQNVFIPIFSGVWTAISGYVRGAIEVIKGVIDIFIGIFSGDWKRVWEGAKKILGGVWTAIQGIVKGGLKIMGTILGQGWELIGKLFRLGLDKLKDLAIWGLGQVVDQFLSLPSKIKGIGKLMLSAGKYIMGQLWEGLKNIATDFLPSLGATILNGLIDIINFFIDEMNDLIPDVIKIKFAPDIDLPNTPIPNIPHLATGGRASNATLAVFGEGREAETVLPDSMLRGLLEKVHESGKNEAQQGNGPALAINIESVEAHDYEDFMHGMQRRSRQLALSGFTLPSGNGRRR